MLRSALPHSQRIHTSERSPLVPRSSIHNLRYLAAQSFLPLWTKVYQSISPIWPQRHALTNRTGTTGLFLRLRSMNLPRVSSFRCTSIRERLLDSEGVD